jgi:hypothetical protein
MSKFSRHSSYTFEDGTDKEPETSVTTNLFCVKSQKGEDLMCKCIWSCKNSTNFPPPTILQDCITQLAL